MVVINFGMTVSHQPISPVKAVSPCLSTDNTAVTAVFEVCMVGCAVNIFQISEWANISIANLKSIPFYLPVVMDMVKTYTNAFALEQFLSNFIRSDVIGENSHCIELL